MPKALKTEALGIFHPEPETDSGISLFREYGMQLPDPENHVIMIKRRGMTAVSGNCQDGGKEDGNQRKMGPGI